MRRRMRMAARVIEQRKETYGRGLRSVSVRYEPRRITLKEQTEAHRESHPNDLGERKIRTIRSPTPKQIARDKYLEGFYKTHEYIGEWPNAKWVEINGDEEE